MAFESVLGLAYLPPAFRQQQPYLPQADGTPTETFPVLVGVRYAIEAYSYPFNDEPTFSTPKYNVFRLALGIDHVTLRRRLVAWLPPTHTHFPPGAPNMPAQTQAQAMNNIDIYLSRLRSTTNVTPSSFSPFQQLAYDNFCLILAANVGDVVAFLREDRLGLFMLSVLIRGPQVLHERVTMTTTLRQLMLGTHPSQLQAQANANAANNANIVGATTAATPATQAQNGANANANANANADTIVHTAGGQQVESTTDAGVDPDQDTPVVDRARQDGAEDPPSAVGDASSQRSANQEDEDMEDADDINRASDGSDDDDGNDEDFRDNGTDDDGEATPVKKKRKRASMSGFSVKEEAKDWI